MKSFLSYFVVPVLLCSVCVACVFRIKTATAMLLAQTPTTAAPPVIPPSPGLAVFDPTPVVAAFGQASAWNSWADKSITALGQQAQSNAADIAALKAQNASSIGARKSASGYTIRIPAISLIGASAPANFQQPTACGLASKLILDAAGNYYDFLVNAPQAGNYVLAENVAFDVAGIPFVNHFESPPGTKVGGSITVSSTNGWNTSPNSAPVPLQPGFQIVRLVVDTTVPNSANALCWIQVTEQ